MDFESKVLAAMADAGINICGKIDWCNKNFQRFRDASSYRRGKPLFVKIFEGGVYFGDWRDESTHRAVFEDKEISQNEKIVRLKTRAEERMLQHYIKERAIYRANELLNHRSWWGKTCFYADEDHPYCVKKRIIPYYARQCRQTLVVPIQNISGRVISLQFIRDCGRKRFKKGTSCKDGFAMLGDAAGDEFWLCEGWATGCTVKEVTGKTVFCAMSASNIKNVAILLRRKFIHARINIAADCDTIGLESAQEAAKIINGKVYCPVFPPHLPELTDFNDLYVLDGFDAVEAQLI